MLYDLSNSDLGIGEKVKGPMASKCTRGTVIKVLESVPNCSFGFNHYKNPVIPPGTYKVVDRRRFVAGYQVIEPIK